MAKKLKITNHIRKYRFIQDEMTQQELATKAGVSRQSIISMEANKYSPSLELAFKLAEALGVSVTELFEYEVID